MSNRSGSPYSSPRDANHVPLLIAASTVDGVSPVVLEADPTTHQLQVSGSGGGGGSDVQYADGDAAITHPIGTIPVFNKAGTITAVSDTNPLPVDASVTVTGGATATNQTSGSQKTQIVDGSGNVIAATSNALDINIKSGNPTSITANAGTNLDTSALALETGGNLAAIKADVDKIPSQGQALAAASMPVVLPASQVTTLTPPTNVGLNAGTNAIGSITNTSFSVTQTTAANLNATVVGTGTFAVQAAAAGDVASAATDSGNPVKIGAKFNTTQPTVTDGQRVDLQANARGELKTTITQNGNSAAIGTAGADGTSNTVNMLAVTSYGKNFNGTTWDRTYGDATNGTWVNVKNEVPGVGATNLGKAEDAAHTSGDTGVFALGVRNDGAATSFTNANGDYNPVATDVSGRLYVAQKSGTSTHSNVSVSTTSATLIAANTARVGASIYNDSTTVLYVATNGSAASATNFKIAMAAGSYFEVPAGITTAITGVLASSTGTARVDEDT